MRLYQLADSLSLPSMSLLSTLQVLGGEKTKIRSHLSPVPMELVNKIRGAMQDRMRLQKKDQPGTESKATATADAQITEPAEQDAPDGAPTKVASRAELARQKREEARRLREEKRKKAMERARQQASEARARQPLVAPETATPAGESEIPTAKKKAMIREESRRSARRHRRAKRKGRSSRRSRSSSQKPIHKVTGPITLTPPVTVKEFSNQAGIRVPLIIKKLFMNGMRATINDVLSEDTIELLALEFDLEINFKRERELEDVLVDLEEVDFDEGEEAPRAPIVTILGHVDHGKTTLLDTIRKSNVVAGEAGGITQHIAAWRVTREDGSHIVFVDTPGHEAFTEMRRRGAGVTDIVVLVVAADDGVMPQTEEAIAHARAAKVPIVVALNKIDRPNAKPERVLNQLSALGLIPEKWGGDTSVVQLSALTGNGVPDLLEVLTLEAELLELTAHPSRPAIGTCLESRLTEGRGVVAQLLVQDGVLKVGDAILCGSTSGKVRAILDDLGNELEVAGPSRPISVLGLNVPPGAGEKFYVLKSMAEAKAIGEKRQQEKRQAELAKPVHMSMDNLFDLISAEKIKEVRVILKADVHGSVEVLKKALEDLSTEEVRVKVLHAAVGGVNESDVILADASEAFIIGFQVVPEEKARSHAEEKSVDIRLYNVIYQVTEEMKLALEGLLEPDRKEVNLGWLQVRKTFKSSAVGTIAGCYVEKGKVTRDALVRLTRNNLVIYKGRLSSLRRYNDDAKEVQQGYECGVKIANYDDVKEGDRIEAYEIIEVARTL